jgi:hypothetical protein
MHVESGQDIGGGSIVIGGEDVNSGIELKDIEGDSCLTAPECQYRRIQFAPTIAVSVSASSHRPSSLLNDQMPLFLPSALMHILPPFLPVRLKATGAALLPCVPSRSS